MDRMIERLKKNTTPWWLMDEDERAFLKQCKQGMVRRTVARGASIVIDIDELGINGGAVYRLSPDCEEPKIVPPIGFRLVTQEERSAHEQPSCAVLYDYPENRGGSIHPITWGISSPNNGGWENPEYIFAVPSCFSFEEPKKRWFFPVNGIGEQIPVCADTPSMVNSIDENLKAGHVIEVQESDLPYLEKPEGEWEFRIAEDGEEFITNDYSRVICGANNGFRPNPAMLSGYRWCKPRKAKGRWVEYPIYEDGEYWICEVSHLKHLRHFYFTTELPHLVGFGGVQFEETPNAWWWHLGQHTASGKPATPIKARFWVEDER